MSEPVDVGQILKSEREKRSLTLEVIHEATKIPMDSLRAIEEGYKIRTLTTFYYKSFVKIYAQYLGMDAKALLELLPRSTEKPAFKKKPEAVRAVMPKIPAVKELNLFAGPVVKPAKVKKAAVIVAMVIGVTLAGWLVTVVFGKIRAHVAVQSELDAAAKKSPAKSKVKKSQSARQEQAQASEDVTRKSLATSTKTEVAAKVEGSSEAQPVRPRKASLTVRAPVTAWLTVRVDGSTVFQGSLKKGNSESWSASKKIELSGKGIYQLEYEVNGKTIGKLGSRSSSARKIIVTPEGLSVEK